MKVRAAEQSDLPIIVEIEGLCFPEETAFPPGMFSYLIRYSNALVACESGEYDANDEVVGFIIGYASGRMGIIYTLDVHPSYWGRGIGSALIAALEKELSEEGAEVIRLEAAVDNPRAMELYRRAGYRERELIRGYYGWGKNAVRMWKMLCP
jgi:[ribosomal protein S18]-alanine N-acetyltransferase